MTACSRFHMGRPCGVLLSTGNELKETPHVNTGSSEIPDGLLQQANALVSQGWASNVREVVNESLRRYLESHQDVLAERFVRDDVA